MMLWFFASHPCSSVHCLPYPYALLFSGSPTESSFFGLADCTHHDHVILIDVRFVIKNDARKVMGVVAPKQID